MCPVSGWDAYCEDMWYNLSGDWSPHIPYLGISYRHHSVQNLLSSLLLPGNTKIRIYKVIIFPVVLYWCETWCLILWREYRLRVFESRVLRRAFGPKRDEVTGESRKLQNDELHDLYSSPSLMRIIKSRRMMWREGGRRGTCIGYW
jgi:hypothetical protein